MAKFAFLDFNKVLTANVSGKHALVGAATGAVGIGAVKWGLNTIKVGGLPLAAKIPPTLARFTPLLTSVIAAFAGYALLKKASPKNANSFAIGSLSAGAVLTVTDFLRTSFPSMSDLVTYRLPGMGYVTQSPKGRLNQLAGFSLLTPDTGNSRLNRLASAAMDDYVEYDVG